MALRKPFCVTCSTTTGKFMDTQNQIFGAFKKIPFCMDCIRAMYLSAVDKFDRDSYLALYHVCIILSIPYIKTMADKAVTAAVDSDIVFAYLSLWEKDRQKRFSFWQGTCTNELQVRGLNLRSMKADAKKELVESGDAAIKKLMAHKEKLEQEILELQADIDDKKKIEIDITDELFAKWGYNEKFEEQDYAILETHLAELKASNPDANERQRMYFTDLCQLHLLKQQAYRKQDIDDAKRITDAYSKQVTDSGLRPSDDRSIQNNDVSLSNIVQICEADGFIEPWDRQTKYPHKKDYADFAELNYLNHIRRNFGKETLFELPEDMQQKDINGEFEGD